MDGYHAVVLPDAIYALGDTEVTVSISILLVSAETSSRQET